MSGEKPLHRIGIMDADGKKKGPEQLAAEAEKSDENSIDERLRMLGIILTPQGELADGSAKFVCVNGRQARLVGPAHKGNKTAFLVEISGIRKKIGLFSPGVSAYVGE